MGRVAIVLSVTTLVLVLTSTVCLNVLRHYLRITTYFCLSTVVVWPLVLSVLVVVW